MPFIWPILARLEVWCFASYMGKLVHPSLVINHLNITFLVMSKLLAFSIV
jgi:hypothetical protein